MAFSGLVTLLLSFQLYLQPLHPFCQLVDIIQLLLEVCLVLRDDIVDQVPVLLGVVLPEGLDLLVLRVLSLHYLQIAVFPNCLDLLVLPALHMHPLLIAVLNLYYKPLNLNSPFIVPITEVTQEPVLLPLDLLQCVHLLLYLVL